MHSIQIVQATPADTPEVIRLFGALHRFNAELAPHFALADGWEELVEQYLSESEQSDDSVWLLACDQERPIGFVLVEIHIDSPLYRHRRWAEIVGLYVEAAYRGSQVAQLLMEQAYRWARSHNLRVMQLYVTASNHQARRFYDKQGFVDSQLIMRRPLIEADGYDETPARYAHHRLHFSEGGARPLDMHHRSHLDEARNTDKDH